MVRVVPPNVTPVQEEHAPRQKRQRQATLPSSSDLWVQTLPGLDSLKTTLFAGNLPAAPPSSDTDAHLYFLLARNKHIPNRQRLVIWFNGGPGCSSFDGSLIEIGPYRINPNGTVREVERGAWNEYANVLFLDQPAGTGYSYVTKNDRVRELDEAADQVVQFLVNLYKVFPEFATMDTYLAGESYAGQYIPYIASAIKRSRTVSTPLKGLLIGNGWIDPKHQYPAYLEYLVEHKFLRRGSAGYRNVLNAVKKCGKKMHDMERTGKGKGTVLVGECEEILGVMSAATMKDGLCLNSYDTREYHACGAEWPPDLTQVTKYLRDPEVIKALHGEGAIRPWSQCDNTVASHFWTPQSVPSVQLLPELLETIPILLYAGDADLMCAGIGIENSIEEMEWAGLKGFNGSEVLDWTVDGKPAGRWTTRANLTYVEVKNSSHMVPMDQPLAAHDMLLRFMAVDTLGSAGPSARIPSRVGHGSFETILGSTRPNGSTLAGAGGGGVSLDPSSDHDVISPLDGSNQGAGVELGGGGIFDSDDSGGLGGAGGRLGGTGSGLGSDGSKAIEDGFDINHERYYGPRRTAALVSVLVIVGVVAWFGLKWRRRRRLERFRGGQSRGTRGFRGKGTPRGARGGRVRLGDRDDDDEERGYAMARTTNEDDDDEDDDRGRRSDPRSGTGSGSNEKRIEPREAVETVAVFDVGEDDDDDDDDSDGSDRSRPGKGRHDEVDEDEDAWGDLGRHAEVWGDNDDDNDDDASRVGPGKEGQRKA
ncbi:hypothetical protein JCM10212_003403 [Sporobolomyces blumeae]